MDGGLLSHVRQAWREVPTGTSNREAKADREVTWG